MARKFNVLISSAGRRVRLVEIFRQALESLCFEGHVVATDMSPLSSAFHRADRAYVVPPCRDQKFIPEMLDLCRRESISLVIPTIDTELSAYAENRELFEQNGTVVAVSDARTIAIGADKILTHEWLIKNSLPRLRQASVEEVLSDPNNWAFPLFTKPRAGSASIGVRIVQSIGELGSLPRSGGYIVQEMARGREYTIDLLVGKDGNLLDCIPRLRLETRAGEASKAITVRKVELEELAIAVHGALPNPYGCLNVQVFWDEAERVSRIIEINPRFGGGFPLAWAAGALYPKWMIEEIAGLKCTGAYGAWREHVLMLRYDDEVIVEDGASLL